MWRIVAVLLLAGVLAFPAAAQMEGGDTEVTFGLSYDRSTQTLEYSGTDYETQMRNTIFNGSLGHFVSERSELGGALMLLSMNMKMEGDDEFTGMGFGYASFFYNYHWRLKDPRTLMYVGGELVKGFFLGWDEEEMGVPAPSIIGVGLTFGAKKFISEKTYIGLQDNLRIQSYSMEMGSLGDMSVTLISIIFSVNMGIVF